MCRCRVQRNASPRWRVGGLRAASEALRRAGAPASRSPALRLAAWLGRPQHSGLLVQVQQVRRAAGGVVGCRLRLLVASRSRGGRRGDELVHARGDRNSNNDGCSSNDASGSDENHAAVRGRQARAERAVFSAPRWLGLSAEASRTVQGGAGVCRCDPPAVWVAAPPKARPPTRTGDCRYN